jgi:iron complex outermembrane recepter protein
MVSARQAVTSILRSARSRSGSRPATARAASAASALYLLTATLSWAPHAFAQEAPASENSTAPLEEVTVTGSRIKRTTDYTTPTPTTVLDATTMENMGVVNVGQALEMTPANISAYTPATTGGSSFFTGQYIADLRGLNGFFTSRTLTMIDGQRAVPTSTGDSFDLNFVPQVLVQRIDTVTGGASAAYGSGAESGVLNVILDHQLEGGKLNADEYDTHYNDGKESHVSAAYGHGLFDNRVHFVLGAEYAKQDPALCQTSGRTWCSNNTGPYTASYPLSPFDGQLAIGSNLRTNVMSSTGAIATEQFYFPAFGYGVAPGQPLLQASNDGLGAITYTGNNAPGGGASAAPGGMGTPSNQYTNLLTATQRSVITGLFTAKVTDNINATLDLNWGKVNAFNPGGNEQSFAVGTDNPFLPAGTAALGAAPNGYYVGKDWTSQIGNDQFNDTTLKRISVGLNGKFGDTSWSWDANGEYGLTENVEGSPNEFKLNEASMALDTVTGANGQPECRITANGGSLANALASAIPAYGPANIFGTTTLPAYLNTYEQFTAPGAAALANFTNPVTGLTEIQTLNLLGQNCQPLNPFGNSPLNSSAAAYSTGPLSLDLRYTQTVFAVNTSGDLWKGIGAGAFTMAAGYEWRQEVVHNNFSSCPDGLANTTTAEQLCLASTTDFEYQFGNAYGGTVNVDEVYTEFNVPLLKNEPFAKTLEFDLAARESRYKNEALYAVGIEPGATGTHDLTTWKASMIYEPVDGLRFRASQSRDSRAPSPRDLYYSQSFVPGSFFGTCGNPNVPNAVAQPCYINLVGNANLKPETSNTTTVGLVFTPVQAPGLQASSDWFHIHITDGINGGSIQIPEQVCADGGAASTAACSDLTFNSYSYNTAGQACGSGVAGPVLAGGANCAGAPTKTGAAAYQQAAGAVNVIAMNGPAYNGAFYDERGIDFSLQYFLSLPGGSTLSARALTTWVGEQVYQNYAGGQVYNLVGQTGSTGFLADYTPAARWNGNLSLTWSLGGFSLTPNVHFVGEGTLDNLGVTSNQTQLYNWILTSYPDAGKGLPDSAAQAAAKALGLVALPVGISNHMPSYFLFGLNAAYTFDKIPGIKTLQLYTQIENLLNKAPPTNWAAAGDTTTNPIFFNQLGLAYRAGFRMTF